MEQKLQLNSHNTVILQKCKVYESKFNMNKDIKALKYNHKLLRKLMNLLDIF